MACGPKAKPTSMTSGACGPLLSLLALMASSSSPEPASGFSSLTVMPYLAREALDDFAVVAPVVRQGDRRQFAFGLGGSDQLVQIGRRCCLGAAGGSFRCRLGCRLCCCRCPLPSPRLPVPWRPGRGAAQPAIAIISAPRTAACSNLCRFCVIGILLSFLSVDEPVDEQCAGDRWAWVPWVLRVAGMFYHRVINYANSNLGARLI